MAALCSPSPTRWIPPNLLPHTIFVAYPRLTPLRSPTTDCRHCAPLALPPLDSLQNLLSHTIVAAYPHSTPPPDPLPQTAVATSASACCCAASCTFAHHRLRASLLICCVVALRWACPLHGQSRYAGQIGRCRVSRVGSAAASSLSPMLCVLLLRPPVPCPSHSTVADVSPPVHLSSFAPSFPRPLFAPPFGPPPAIPGACVLLPRPPVRFPTRCTPPSQVLDHLFASPPVPPPSPVLHLHLDSVHRQATRPVLFPPSAPRFAPSPRCTVGPICASIEWISGVVACPFCCH